MASLGPRLALVTGRRLCPRPVAVVGAPPSTGGATRRSGLVVVLTKDPPGAGVWSGYGSTVSFGGGRGTCISSANQPGNANWLSAPQVQQVFQVKNHTPG